MPAGKETDRLVVKVGGSLFDLPDLGDRLRRWLGSLDMGSVLLVPGGGALADAIRKLDAVHHLGEEAGHWLALQTLAVTARFLLRLLPEAILIEHPDNWPAGMLAVLDPYAFALADEGNPGALPYSWSVTSDSIAARAARIAGVGSLVLLKSVDIPPGADWREAAAHGWVDAYFAAAVGEELAVEAVNLRISHR
jgi:aspartokinase-like uncharacterized kinase